MLSPPMKLKVVAPKEIVRSDPHSLPRSSSPEAKAAMLGSQQLHRMIPPDVVARAICYLLSPDGAWYGGDRFYITNGANVGLKPVNLIPDDD